MFGVAKRAAKSLGVDTRDLYQRMSLASLNAAVREQGLDTLASKLRDVVPDLSDQYTGLKDPVEYARYWEPKMRYLHAFQVRLALDALTYAGVARATIVDVGDSAGTHGKYIGAVAAPGSVGRFISVNLDPVAVDKINARGGEAILSRAEELDHETIKPDLYISFETIEHLTDPLRFMHDLATKGAARVAAVTIPYRKDSRFGGALIRQSAGDVPAMITAEQVHIFELSPADWQLMFRFAGWRTVEARTYRQYPLCHPLRLTAPLWRRLDFEGFMGFILERDRSLSDRYQEW